jgi:large subunit ribosomal protein L23
MVVVSREKLMHILLEPRVTEKSTMVGDKYNQVVFKVAKKATKPEIKKAVEFLFKVEVDSVQVISVKGKQKTHRNARGRRSDWKKAYVKLKPGFEIDFMSF